MKNIEKNKKKKRTKRMLGLNRARYQSEVLSQRKQNEFLISTFNNEFGNSMADYSTVFGNLAQKLNTFTPCQTCSDPWHAKKKLIEDLQNLNDRYGYALDYQMSIGNTNSELVIASQNFTAQRPFFEKQLQMIRDNPQQTTDDKAQLQADLAKLDQSIRIATAVVPTGTKHPPLQLVRGNYLSEDIKYDEDPLYRAEVANYIEAETQFVQQAFAWLLIKLEHAIAERSKDKTTIQNVQTKMDTQNTTLEQSLVNWQRIQTNAINMEQQYGFVIIPRNVFEPHADMATAPPILLSAEEQIPQDEDDANDMAQKLHDKCDRGLELCTEQFENLAKLNVWDKKLQQNTTENDLEQSRKLRETVRELRGTILDMLRSAQFLAFGLLQWNEHGPQPQRQPEPDYQKEFESLSPQQFSEIWSPLFDVLGIDFYCLESKLNLLVEELAVLQKSYDLSQKRVSQQTIDIQEEFKMENDIKQSQEKVAQIETTKGNAWRKFSTDRQDLTDLEKKWNQSLAFIHVFDDSAISVAIGDEKVDNQHRYSELLNAIQTQFLNIKNHIEDYRKSIIQLQSQSQKTEFASKIPPMIQARQLVVHDLYKLSPLVNSVSLFLQSQPVVRLEYVDNDDLGYSITVYLKLQNDIAQAQLDYYEDIAKWLEARHNLKLQRSGLGEDAIAEREQQLQYYMQSANEKRKLRDEFAQKAFDYSLAIYAKEQSTGYNFGRPVPPIANKRVFVIDEADENQKLVEFKNSIAEERRKLKNEEKYLGIVSTAESQQNPNNLKNAKQQLIANLAPFVDRDHEFDRKFHTFLNQHFCKSHFVLDSPEYNVCVVSRCGDDPNECKQLFAANSLNAECEDIAKCKVALSICQSKMDCETKVNNLRKPETKIKHYCATTFAPYNDVMYQTCLEKKCESQDTNHVCTSLEKQVENSRKKAERLEATLKQFVDDIPKLAFAQQKQYEITSAARQDPSLNLILKQMNDDLQNPSPSSFGEIGPLVNMRHKTLVAMQTRNSPALAEAAKEWERWIQATVQVVKTICAKEPWCLQKTNCATGACAELIKQ